MDGVCPSAYAFSVASRGSASIAVTAKANAQQVLGQRLWLTCTHSCASIACSLACASPHIDIAISQNQASKRVRGTILSCACRLADNLEKRKPKCAAETATSFRFVVTHWRFHRTSPCIFRSAQGRFRSFLRRAVGGSWQTASGQSPEPHKRLYNSLFAFSILNKLWVLVSR